MAEPCEDQLMSMSKVGDRKMEDFYVDLILKYLGDPTHILPTLGDRLSFADSSKTFKLRENNKDEEATRYLIEKLKDAYPTSWLHELKKALPEQSILYQWLDWEPRKIAKKLDGQKEFEQMMLFIFKHLIDVKVDDVMPELVTRNMLTSRDVEEVTRIQDRSNARAMQTLLYRLPYKSDNFLVRLIRALQGKYDDLLDGIHPDLPEAGSIQIPDVLREAKSKERCSAPVASESDKGSSTASRDSPNNRQHSSSSERVNGKERSQRDSPSSSHSNTRSSTSAEEISNNLQELRLTNATSPASGPDSYSFTTKEYASPAAEPERQSDDLFYSMIDSTMIEIEQHISKYPAVMELLTDVPNIQTLMKLQGEHGTDKYTSSVEKLKRETVKIYDQTKRHFFVSCSRHLLLYNKALMVYIDCRAKEALDYIKKELKEVGENLSLAGNETDRWLNSLFSGMEQCLSDISCSTPGNSGLTRLRSAIMEECKKPNHPSGVVLCRSTEVAAALVKWMKECPHLAELNPFLLEKATAKEDISRYFRRGLHKLIVTPSGVVKDADTSKCGYVLLHDNVSQLRVPDKPSRDVETDVKRDENMYELRCLKCDLFVVSSKDLRTVDKAHHIVRSSLEDRATFEVHPSPKKYNKWEKKEKIFCKKCHEDWGVKAMYKGQTLYCVLTVPSFTIVSPSREKKHYKDWKEVPFSVAAVDDD